MRFIGTAVTLLITGVVTTSHFATAQTVGQTTSPWGPPNPQIEIAYVEPKNPALRPFYEKLKQRQVLEILQAFLAPLRLPRKLTITTDECGNAGAHYQPGG